MLILTGLHIPYSAGKDPEFFFPHVGFSKCILEAPRILLFDPGS